MKHRVNDCFNVTCRVYRPMLQLNAMDLGVHNSDCVCVAGAWR